MKNLTLLLLFFCLFPTLTIAQPTFSYFNKLYSTDSTTELSPSSYPMEDGYLTVGSLNSFNGYEAIYVQKIDRAGNLVWRKILEDGPESTGMLGGNTLTPTSDGHFVAVGSKATYDPTVGDLRAVLIKFNKEGEVIWKKFHGDTTTLIAPKYILETKDKGFIMAGSWRLKDSYYIRFYVLRVDSLGNFMWEKQYNTNNQSGASSMEPTADGGYIIAGYQFQGNSTQNADAYVLKIDSVGNKLWDKKFGGPRSDGGAKITATKDGDYILSWALTEEGETPSIFDTPTTVYFTRLSEEGEVLGENFFETNTETTIQNSLLPTADNGYMAIGLYRNQDYIYNPIVYRLDENLDTLWSKPIFHSHQTHDYIRHMIVTPDKGYLLTGFIENTFESWLVKIDSLGNTCSYVGCDSTINLQSPLGISNFSKQTTLKISPNPIQNAQKATITLPNISHYHQVTLQVFNATGQLVQEQWVLPYQKELLLTTKGLSNGLYFCRLVGDGHRIEEGKLVVVR